MTLEKRLKALGMTKKGLADALGVTPECVYRWENTPKYADCYLLQLEQYKELRDSIGELIK